MPRCGATFNENSVLPWTRGDFRGVCAPGTNPTRRCAPPLRRRGFAWSEFGPAIARKGEEGNDVTMGDEPIPQRERKL
jgi:hypothetical protein